MRKSLRLPNYDYSTPGAYAITTVARDRACLFGTLERTSDSVVINAAGQMVRAIWTQIPQRHPGVSLDAFTVMPDHVHGIVILQRTTTAAVSLVDVLHWFKTITTTKYFAGVKDHGWPHVRGKVWQRSFFDHVIRDEEDLQRLREYIERNPGALFERLFSKA